MLRSPHCVNFTTNSDIFNTLCYVHWYLFSSTPVSFNLCSVMFTTLCEFYDSDIFTTLCYIHWHLLSIMFCVLKFLLLPSVTFTTLCEFHDKQRYIHYFVLRSLVFVYHYAFRVTAPIITKCYVHHIV